MWTRMESTCISTNLAILKSSLSYHRVFRVPPAFVEVLRAFTHVQSSGVAGFPACLIFDGDRASKEAPACPDRRAFAGVSGVLRASFPDRPGWARRQRRLWVHLHAFAGAPGAPGLCARVLRPRGPDFPPRGARAVQGD